MFELIQWSAPSNIVAGFTHRLSGDSQAPYDAFNLALHVGDDAKQVERNRQWLDAALPGDKSWQWLEQVHGIELAIAEGGPVKVADACYSQQALNVCTVMSADCLPVFLASKDGLEVAVVHAGWRSLCQGVIEQTVKHFTAKGTELVAYLGPAIGPESFEVGEEVKLAFLSQNCGEASMAAFHIQANQRYLADLYHLASIRLHSLGVQTIHGGNYCTYKEQRFYSYRRDGVTGRMASFIYRLT